MATYEIWIVSVYLYVPWDGYAFRQIRRNKVTGAFHLNVPKIELRPVFAAAKLPQPTSGSGSGFLTFLYQILAIYFEVFKLVFKLVTAPNSGLPFYTKCHDIKASIL